MLTARSGTVMVVRAQITASITQHVGRRMMGMELATVDNGLSLDAKIALFRSLFRGREDDACSMAPRFWPTPMGVARRDNASGFSAAVSVFQYALTFRIWKICHNWK